MANDLRQYADEGIKIKRFTYLRDGVLIAATPKKGEVFLIKEDFLGDRSLVWIACFVENKEKWRHNINDITRLTYED